MSNQERAHKSSRARCRKPVLDVDLNAMPPCESHGQEGTSNHVGVQDRQAGQGVGATLPVAINLEVFDDDVIISSPRAFAVAKNNPRRKRGGTIVIDVDSGNITSTVPPTFFQLLPGSYLIPTFELKKISPFSKYLIFSGNVDERFSRNKRGRIPVNQTIINCDLYIHMESPSNPMRDTEQRKALLLSPPPPPLSPQKEPTFSCPVCMGPLVEEMSTKCGHIFCKGCIKAANKCPTCRKKVTMKELIRVYLPATTRSS